jgi:ribosome recycling factor
MSYTFTKFKEEAATIEERLRRELSSIQTGRATPAFLDGIRVEAYGSAMPLNQVASISIEDARTLRISPWDASQSKDIEKAITVANLGVSVSVDGSGVRVFFPAPTAERRQLVAKLVREKLEEGRVAVRSLREATWNDIQAKEKEGGMSEDEKFRYKDEMQKLVDQANAKLGEMADKKEQEVLG